MSGSSRTSSLQRVRDALTRQEVATDIVELADSTRTAQDAARAIGCDVAQIVKSLVFRSRDSERPVLVLASGVNRVDETRVEALLGEAIARADATFVRQHSGFAIGGVAPMGHPVPMTTLIDRELLRFATVWAAAGTPHAVFRITPDELVRVSGATVADVSA